MTLDEVRVFFDTNDKFLLTTHESPDGDGLGAEYALCSALIDLGKEVRILNSDPGSAKFTFYDKWKLIRNLGDKEQLPEDIPEWNLVILDTDPGNIGAITPLVLGVCRDVVVIDHHSPKEIGAFRGWMSPNSSSTCEMVFRIIEAMRAGFKQDVAVALYTGIVYDTGSFIYPKTQARTFRIAETLVSSGAVPNEIFTQLYESKSKGALMLQSLVTSTMVLYEIDRVSVQIMSVDTLIASGADYDESQEIVNIPLQCAVVRVSVFFKENESGEKRCSLRSKGEVDCAAIAHMFGGGGHKTAAGFRFNKPFGEMQDEVLEAIRPYFS
jgi:phosphoesterase RecJ-like protein